MEDFLAKSARNGGTTLFEHTIAVMNVANLVMGKYIKDMDDIIPLVLYACAYHDIGKVVDYWQDWLKNGGKVKAVQSDSYEDGSDPILKLKDVRSIPHNIISWAFLKNNTSFGLYNGYKFKALCSGVLFHHVVSKEDEEYGSPRAIIDEIGEDNLAKMQEWFSLMVDYINETFGIVSVDGKHVELCDNNDKTSKLCDEVVYPLMNNVEISEYNEFSLYYLVRSIVVFSDRLVSSLCEEQLPPFVENDTEYIERCLDDMCKYDKGDINIEFNRLVELGYDDNRLSRQYELVNSICGDKECSNFIVSASAGFGKTLLGTLFSIKEGNKTVWVVPTNLTALSTYNSILGELDKMGLSEDVGVSLYYGGNFEYGNECSDILVTNIDTFLGTMIKNNISHWLFKFLNGTIIFDEYHEFLCSPKAPMFSAFIATAYCLMRHTDSKVLLMSATPHRYDYHLAWGRNLVKFIDGGIYGGDVPLHINVRKYNSIDEFETDSNDSIVVMHSIPNVTNFGIKHKGDGNYMYIHSRFPEDDKTNLLKRAIDNHGKYGNPRDRKQLIGTSFIGFALDITTDNMYDFVVSPDTTIQRGCGRVNRFCDSQNIGTYNFCVIENGKIPNIVSDTYNKKLYYKWVDVMSELDGKTITKRELYEMYNKFSEDNKLDLRNFFENRFKNSAKELTKLTPYHSRYNVDTENKALPKDMLSYRGTSNDVYVVAYKEDGSICKPIKIKERYLVEFEKKKEDNRNTYKDICKEQYEFFLDLMGKDMLKRGFDIRSYWNIDKAKYDIARMKNYPLLLTKAEAIFLDDIGLVLK